MVHLVPMTEAEFAPYRAHLMHEYAQEYVKAGSWHPSEALQRAEKRISPTVAGWFGNKESAPLFHPNQAHSLSNQIGSKSTMAI